MLRAANCMFQEHYEMKATCMCFFLEDTVYAQSNDLCHKLMFEKFIRALDSN